MAYRELLDVLSKVSVLNRDNGKSFTVTDRSDAIASLLQSSKYKRINSGGLFHLYAKKPLEEMPENRIIVSSHIDCEQGITRCFSREEEDGMLRGTYDNAITNAAILYAMLTDSLPENVCVCFTGDEERRMTGAYDLVDYFKKHDLNPTAIVVLDVTDEGWSECADFTIENNFFKDDLGNAVVSYAESTGFNWSFVPEDPRDIPAYVKKSRVIPKEAAEDESWHYDEEGILCFSFCLPVLGDMHSNKGVLVRGGSFLRYTHALSGLLCRIGSTD